MMRWLRRRTAHAALIAVAKSAGADAARTMCRSTEVDVERAFIKMLKRRGQANATCLRFAFQAPTKDAPSAAARKMSGCRHHAAWRSLRVTRDE